MLRAFFVIFILCTIAILAVLGFRGQKSTQPPLEIFPDMVRQPKVRAQAPLDFFADGRGPRLPVAGTVPVGYEMPKPKTESSPPGMTGDAPEEAHMRIAFSAGTDYFNTGKMGDQWGTGIPLPVTRELMERGQQRFNITCAMCHGASAAGNGITKQYGLATVVSLQDDRLRKMSDGEIFNTITNGKNTMMPYGPNIVVADRWAIIAYLRALQRSQHATIADVPEDHRAEMDKPASPPPDYSDSCKMSERLHTPPMPEGEYFDSRRFTGLSTLLGLIAVVSLVLCLVGAFVNPHQFSYSWLFAFVFFFTLCAGCFFWTIVHHATDANWSVVVRRQLENIAVLLGVLAVLFIPILLLRRHLYSWMDIPPGHEANLDSKRAYLNFHWFFIRTIIFFGFWIVASLLLRRFSARQDKDGNPLFTIWMRRLSFISLPLFALCLTFGAVRLDDEPQLSTGIQPCSACTSLPEQRAARWRCWC